MPHTWSILEKNYKPHLSKVNSFKKNGFITFGSFNSSRKINLKVIALWSKILLKISNSKLLLKNNEFEDAYYRESFKDFFRKQNLRWPKAVDYFFFHERTRKTYKKHTDHHPQNGSTNGC